MEIDFDPDAEEFRRDPYTLYRRLQAADSVHRNSQGLWFVTRFRDVETMLRDKRLSRDLRGFFLAQFGAGPVVERYSRAILFLDPPDHTRLRSLVSLAFSARRIESLRPKIQTIVDRLLDQATAGGSIELISELAYPLPSTVISDMVGVPVEDRDRLHRWVDDLGKTLDLRVTAEAVGQGNEAARALSEYLQELIVDRRERPRDDLMSALVQAEEEGRKLDDEELLSTCALLFVAGHETTANLIGNGIYTLLIHPAELAKLRSDPSRIDSAVEECLRYESPVQLTARLAAEDLQLGGKTIRAGEIVVALLGAANRDPEVFAEPDRFDVTREGQGSIGFGGGIHYCLGAALARLEARIAISALVRRFNSFELETTRAEWKDSVTLRGLKELRLQVAPPSRVRT